MIHIPLLSLVSCAMLPCISPTVRDAKMRRVVALAPLSQHSMLRSPRKPLRCCNLTPGHRIPSLHSLPSLSRPATNAVLNAMAHTVVRAAQATTNCSSTSPPPFASSYSSRHSARVPVAFQARVRRLPRRNRRNLYERASQRTQRNASQPQGLTTAPLKLHRHV